MRTAYLPHCMAHRPGLHHTSMSQRSTHKNIHYASTFPPGSCQTKAIPGTSCVGTSSTLLAEEGHNGRGVCKTGGESGCTHCAGDQKTFAEIDGRQKMADGSG